MPGLPKYRFKGDILKAFLGIQGDIGALDPWAAIL
jgi:hypothetical protein